MEMGAALAKPAESTSSSATERKSEKASLSLPKCVLVLLHGLTMDASECDAIKKAAEEKFGKDVEIIAPKCREGWRSARLSIGAQAKKVIEEVQATLHNRCPQCTKEGLKALPINIFGYSQGGLVACMIAANYGHELKIKAIVPALAPLSGADVFENCRADVNKFNERAKPGLEAIGHPRTKLIEAQALAAVLNTRGVNTAALALCQGIRDVRLNSTCITKIRRFVRENKDCSGNSHDIPILLIGSAVDFAANPHKYFEFPEGKEEEVCALIQVNTEFTTGQKDGEGDCLISTRRHLCRTQSWNNVAASVKEKGKIYSNKNVEIHITDDIIHCHNFVSVLSSEGVINGPMLFDSDKDIAVIMDFISQHNELSVER